MGEVIVITSGKGGVGKTTVTANLGAALSKVGKKVCVADADMGLRNLDLALGLESKVVYDCIDVLTGVCKLEDAMIRVCDSEDFCFIPAPQTRNCDYISEKMMKNLADMLRKSFDYILLDSPAGIDRGFKNAIAGADRAIVVTEPYISSVRDADRAIDCLENAGIKDIQLIINCVRPEEIKQGAAMDADSVVDLLGIKILGIVLWDGEILKSAAEGKTVIDNSAALSAAAYKNIAARILGENVPIMEIKPPKKGFLKRLMDAFVS